MKKRCVSCKFSFESYGGLKCGRIDPNTNMKIQIPNSCNVQRKSRIIGLLMGEDLCGINGKYYEQQ